MGEPIGDVAIVEAIMDDIDLIVPLFDQYRVFYGEQSDFSLARQFISARLEQRDSVIFLAISNGDQEIGLGFALLYPSFNSVLATPIWILNDLYVLERVRRKGVARQLIDQGRVLAEETGATVISLSTKRANEPSRKLYERLGFRLDDDFCTYLLHLA